MTVLARCDCGKTYKLKVKFAGKWIRCPNCREAIQVPGPDNEPISESSDGDPDDSTLTDAPPLVSDLQRDGSGNNDSIPNNGGVPTETLDTEEDTVETETNEETTSSKLEETPTAEPETGKHQTPAETPVPTDTQEQEDEEEEEEEEKEEVLSEPAETPTPDVEEPSDDVGETKVETVKEELDEDLGIESESKDISHDAGAKGQKTSLVGIDIGTENLVAAIQSENEDSTTLTNQRNAFIEVPNDEFTLEMIQKRNISYAKKDEKLYLIGNDAFELAQIFSRDPQRPMERGVLSPDETDAIPIISMFLENLIGEPTEDAKAVYSVPADPIDSDFDSAFHESIFEEILSELGYESRSIVEGHAAILSELEDENFTGVAASFGAGMTNCCIAYESIPAVVLSTSRGGRWIDQRASKVSGVNQSRVTTIKERGMNLLNPEGRVEKAIAIYYEDLLNWTVRQIAEQFRKSDSVPEFNDPVTFVATGGTVKVKGFAAKFMEAVEEVGFPIKIDDYRVSEEPLNSVCKGCLVSCQI